MKSCVPSGSETKTEKSLKGPDLVLLLRIRGAQLCEEVTLPSLEIFKHPIMAVTTGWATLGWWAG